MSSEYELILCIVNAGFADTVMDVAYECGARGGTVIDARGTANKEAEQHFKIKIRPEKEMLMLVVPSSIKDDILHALYRQVGLNSPGHGIAFSMPINSVTGLTKDGKILSSAQQQSGADSSQGEANEAPETKQAE